MLGGLLLLMGAGAIAQQGAAAPALALGKPVRAVAVQYANDFDNVRSSSGDSGLCGLVQESKDAGGVIATALDQRRDAITSADLEASLSGGEDTADAQRKAYDAALARLSRALPGVFVADGDVVRFGPDFAALAGAAHEPPSRKLLQESGALLGGGSVLSFAPPPAGAACRRLGPVTEAVLSLAKVWKASPACLRDSVAEALDARLGEIASSSCFCAARDSALAEGEKLADAVSKLPDLGGSRNADYLRRTLADPKTRFACTGGAAPTETPPDGTPAPVATPAPSPMATAAPSEWIPLHYP